LPVFRILPSSIDFSCLFLRTSPHKSNVLEFEIRM
jgi:hypothetical protein